MQRKQKMRYSKLSDDIEFLMQEESGSRKQKHETYKVQIQIQIQIQIQKQIQIQNTKRQKKEGGTGHWTKTKGTETHTNIHKHSLIDQNPMADSIQMRGFYTTGVIQNYYGLDGHTRLSLFTRSSQKKHQKKTKERKERKNGSRSSSCWGNKILPKVFIMVTVQSLSPTNESLHCIEDMLVVHILIW